MRIFLAVLNGVLAVAYPLIVWWALTHFSARVTGLLVMAVLVPLVGLRVLRTDRTHLWPILRMPLAIMALLLIGVATNSQLYIKAMPVLINLVLLVSFGSSLRGEMPMVERFARMQDPDLTPEKCAHCRQVTWAWCVFFVLNGATAGILAVAAPVSWWATYTGGIAYALMGLMFAGEYGLRRFRFPDVAK